MFALAPDLLAAAVAVTLIASTVKGAIGFAMPMIMISGLASFLPAETALAALILPTVATNLLQALRQGRAAAWQTMLAYRRLLILLVLTIVVVAQAVPALPQALILATLGVPIVIFAVSQLLGWHLRFDPRHRGRAEVLAGLIGGFFGGIAGVWGPPTIALLLSLDVDKRESVRVQGVVYLAGSVMLVLAHLKSGVLNAQTLPISALMVIPAMIGLKVGFLLQDRLDARRFRRWTLIVLAVSGLNLVRRALVI